MIVISGGQTGADQAGWRAAKAAVLETTGWMPKGFLTEDGPRPEFAELYGAKEHHSEVYPPRTEWNAKAADLCLWFGSPRSRGGILTLNLAVCFNVPDMVITNASLRPPQQTARWITESLALTASRSKGVSSRVIMVAGNRESSAPGIGEWVEQYLAEVFRLLSENSEKGT